MLTSALAAVATLEVIFFRKYNEAFWAFIVVFRIQIFIKHSPVSKWYPKVRRSSFVPMDLSSFPFSLPTPTQRIWAEWVPAQMELYMKRDDFIHPIVSGNKWRKLKGFFASHQQQPVLTFGGAHSNHLRAAAFAFHHAGLASTAVVRGEELNPTSSATLEFCRDHGMRLLFVSRTGFRALREQNWQPTTDQLKEWQCLDARVLPEGGAGTWALQGCGEIWEEIRRDWIPDHLVLASGTATTAHGILAAMPDGTHTQLHIVSAVKGAKREEKALTDLAFSKNIALHWEDEVHFGGFGKSSEALQNLTQDFHQKTGINLDPVYNSKVLYYLKNNPLEGRVTWLNTGGVFH